MIFTSPISFQHRQRCYVRPVGDVVNYVMEFSYCSDNPTQARLELPTAAGAGEAGLVDVLKDFFYPTFFAHCNRTFPTTPGPDKKTFRGTPEQQLDSYASLCVDESGKSFVQWDLIEGWWRTLPVAWTMPALPDGRLWLPGRQTAGMGLVEYDHWYYIQDHKVKNETKMIWDKGRWETGISINLHVAATLVEADKVMYRLRLADLRQNQDFFLDELGALHEYRR